MFLFGIRMFALRIFGLLGLPELAITGQSLGIAIAMA